MTMKNPYDVSSIQLDFNNPSVPNHERVTSIHRPPVRVDLPSSQPVVKTQQTPQHTSPNSDEMPSETADIFEYLIWSGINVVVGGVILGIPSFILSLLIRRYKRKGKVSRAKILSTITLTLNIIVSFIAMIGLVYLITHFNNPY